MDFHQEHVFITVTAATRLARHPSIFRPVTKTSSWKFNIIIENRTHVYPNVLPMGPFMSSDMMSACLNPQNPISYHPALGVSLHVH